MFRLACFGAGVAVVLSSTVAAAATYKVGPTQQYKQLSAVAGLLAPGDVVEIDGDATYTGGVIFSKAGTAASKITIKGIVKNGKRPIISGATNTIEAQGDHYVFEGLELTGGSFRCFYHHANDIVLRDSVIHDCPKHGLLGADADSGSLLLEYVEVYKCGGGTFDHQIYMATDETAHPKSVFRMQHCYVHDANGGNSVKSRAERNEIYYNWIEGAMYHELELIGPDGQNPALAREDSDVVGNVLRKTVTFSVVRFGGDGTGETGGRYRFVNNTVLVQPNSSAVFRLFDSIESLEAHNNVFAMQGSGTMNLLRQVEAVWTSGSSKIAGSNNWVLTGGANVPGTWTGTIFGTAPGFTNLSAWDVQPTSQSLLVNAGATTLAGPPGYAFPNPLAKPAYHPPKRTLQAPGTAEARPLAGVIDIGAREYATSSGGTGGTGGTSAGGSGGTSAGGTSAGGTSAGGTAGSAAGGAAGSASGGTAGSAGGAAGASSGGASSGGTSAGGGSPATGGATTGGASSTGGASATGGSASASESDDDGGCGCRAPASRGSGSVVWIALGAFLALLRRRR